MGALPMLALLDPLAYPAVLAGVDLASLVVELDGLLRSHGARTQPHPVEALFCARRGMATAIASVVLESDLVARAVLTHVRVAPFFAGVAVAIHPRAEIDAPLLLADLMIVPPGASRAYLDASGPSTHGRSFSSCFLEPLAAIVDGAASVSRSPVPVWMAALSGGCGGRLSAGPGRGLRVARPLVAYVERYLRALPTADRATDSRANAASARLVGDVMRSRGPASKRLTQAFGSSFAARYLRLLWREDRQDVPAAVLDAPGTP